MSKDPRVDAYIEKKADFARPILTHLRDLIHGHAPAVEETIKWSMPFFTYKGELLANMAAFKAHAAFGFWSRGDLATGQEGEAMGQYGRITDVATMPPDKILLAALDKATAMIDAGTKPKRATKGRSPRPRCRPYSPKRWPGIPKHRPNGMPSRRDAGANIANGSPTPSATRTRTKRVAQTVAQTREGKRMNWKYENC